ncbi:MAG TPA: DUF1800 domain-containing protein [Fimbriimonadaceae bacterium]|nr:DUF1800 domain-containing protein [Fimbriimonadaceae bacterium]
MKLTRRELFQAGAAGAVLGAAGCSPGLKKLAFGPPPDLEPPAGFEDADAALLYRIGFGPAPGELERLHELGREAYIDRQLAAAEEDSLELKFRLSRLDVLRLTESDMHDLPEERILEQLQQAAILRAVHSPNQLLERMSDFWTNHFNIYARKGYAAWRKPGDDLNVIRKNALGKFPDLLKASAHSPAMLAYLDNQVNVKGVANENYARELMELHSLGVDGGYTQKDVKEVARCFTGWTIERRFLRPRGKFRFDPELHDDGEKTVLGHRIPAGGGVEDGERVLEILGAHPATAKFIGEKLARYFLGEEASPWPKRLAESYLATGGDLKQMIRPMLLSEEMKRAKPIFKRPFDFVVSSVRAFGGQTDGGKAIQGHLEAMGQPLHQWPMPDGYPDRTAAWTGSLLARWNFALALAHGEIDGTSVDLERLPGKSEAERRGNAARLALAHTGNRAMEKVLSSCATDREAVALCLAAPGFQWR